MKRFTGVDLVNLLTQKHHDLMVKYGLNYGQVANYKHKYKSLLIQELNDIKERLMEQNPKDTEKQELVDRLLKALEENDISLETVGEIERLRVGSYQVVTKRDDGEAEIHNLSAINAVFAPKQATEQDYVRQAKPTKIYPVKHHITKPKNELTILVGGDGQRGFRRYEDGTFEPTHADYMEDIFLQLARHINPDKTLLLGDELDLPNFSRWDIENTFRETTQESIDTLHDFLSKIRANSDGDIIYLEGNHELRLTKKIREYNGELDGLRRANAAHELGVLTLPFLLRLDELGVDYVEAYPAGRYHLTDDLQVIHGTQAKQSGKTAGAVVQKEQVSTIFGHTHRAESAQRTINVYKDGKLYPKIIIAQSFGTMARIDGAVPSYGSGVKLDHRPETNYENWQNGLGIIRIRKGGAFVIEHVQVDPITHEAYYDHKVFKSNA